MEEELNLWRTIFSEKIKNVTQTDDWILEEEEDLEYQRAGWKSYTQHGAFAWFCCSSCGHTWSSVHVTIQFCMTMDTQYPHIHQVKMRILRQRCKKCQNQFEKPEFQQRKISRILGNLMLSIRKECYRERIDSTPRDVNDGEHTEGPHESKFCEACRHGVCKFRSAHFRRISPTSLLANMETEGTAFKASQLLVTVCVTVLVNICVTACIILYVAPYYKLRVENKEPTWNELLQEYTKLFDKTVQKIYSSVCTINSSLHHRA